MNILQSLRAPVEFCVTLNQIHEIDPGKIIREITYHHPVYTSSGLDARKRFKEISGRNRTHFCGAYWGYGFHEDGVKSALAVCETFGKGL
jgi:predicted NAD/FAD-binding protein